jgi:hypothetical protein
MMPAQENVQFEDLAQTMRSAESRRADDLGRWLRLLVERRRPASAAETVEPDGLLSRHG